MPTITRSWPITISPKAYAIWSSTGNLYKVTNPSGDFVRRRSSYKYNEKDRRPKPQDLIAASTSLSEQHFKEIINSIAYRRYSTSGGKWWYSAGTDLNSNEHFPRLGPEPEYWDWPLLVRQEMEDLNINLGESIIEYRQSARMFGNFAEGVRDAGVRIRKSKAYRRNPIQALSGDWLTYSYGLKPLASDLAASVAALKERMDKPIYRTIKKMHSESLKGLWTNGLVDFETHRVQREYVRVHYLVKAGGEGIQFGSIPELAWESIPFSFVVDWGWNIGDTLGALDALRGVTKIYATHSKKRLYRHWSKGQVKSYNIQITEGNAEYRDFVRTLYRDIPLPQMPKWDPSFSWRTIANGMALLGSMFPGKYAWNGLRALGNRLSR